VEGSGRGLILKYYPGICLEELRKTSKNVSQDSQCPGRDSSQTLSDNMSEVLPLELTRSVSWRFTKADMTNIKVLRTKFLRILASAYKPFVTFKDKKSELFCLII
jgi:hypothetical protein